MEFVNFTWNKCNYQYNYSVSYSFNLHFGSNDETIVSAYLDDNPNADYISIYIPSNWGASYQAMITLVQNGNYYKSFGIDSSGNYVSGDATFFEKQVPSDERYTMGTFTATMYPVAGHSKLSTDTIIGAPMILSNGLYRAKE